MTTEPLCAPSIDPDEVAFYEKLAHRWWDTDGPFWPLHKLNAFRVGYIREHLSHTFGTNPAAEHPLEGLRLLDIGCGGGILSESMAGLDAHVTGVDVTPKNIRGAELHAERSGLDLNYRLASAETLAAGGEPGRSCPNRDYCSQQGVGLDSGQRPARQV